MRKIKKVLLFTSPVFTFKDAVDVNPLPPMGLGYLAAMLQKKGIATAIFDSLIEGWDVREEIDDKVIRLGASFDQIRETIREFAPDLVGVNMLFTKQRANAHRIFEIAKSIDPGIVTVAGGAHVTVMPGEVVNDKNVDFAILGEGENTICDLVELIEGRKSIDELDGIAYRNNGQIKIVPKTKFIMDLDTIPFPAWDKMKLERYFGLSASHGIRTKQRFAPIITSRGCPAKCTFCSAYRVWGRRYRERSAENVLAEMKELKDRYQIEELMFEDDNVTFNKERAKKIFRGMIDNRFDFIYDTPNGVAAYTLDEELLRLMKNSGCYKLNLALESGNQEVLTKLIKKPLRLDRVKPLIKYAKKIRLNVGLFLIIGIPGEKLEQMMETFKMAADLDIFDIHVSVATPYPGTELYDQCVEKGYLGENFTLDDLYIRSFCINTEDWTGEQVREVLARGLKFLFLEKIRRHPIRSFIYYATVALKHPDKALNRVISYGKYFVRKLFSFSQMSGEV